MEEKNAAYSCHRMLYTEATITHHGRHLGVEQVGEGGEKNQTESNSAELVMLIRSIYKHRTA